MAATAPYGNDIQPKHKAIVKAGNLHYVPSYSSQRQRTYDDRIGNNQPWMDNVSNIKHPDNEYPLRWKRQSPLPPIKHQQNGVVTRRETERKDGQYMDGVTYDPQEINDERDFGGAIQIKRMLDGYDRSNLRALYRQITSEFDSKFSDKMERIHLSKIFVRNKVPLTARIMDQLFDRFTYMGEPEFVNYSKLLVYLDKIYTLAQSGVTDYRDYQSQETRQISPPDQVEHTAENLDPSLPDLYETNDIILKDAHEKIRHEDVNDLKSRYPGYSTKFESSTNNPNKKLTKEDIEDSEILLMLVSHLSKSGHTVNLSALKKSLYDADFDKSTYLPHGMVKRLFNEQHIHLDDWMLDALLNRCDLKSTGTHTCWVAIIEFLERTQPFSCQKSPTPSSTPQPLNKTNLEQPKPINMMQPPLPNIGSQPPVNPSLQTSSKLEEVEKWESNYAFFIRALRGADIEKTGVLSFGEAGRMINNYNIVYGLGISDQAIQQYLASCTRPGENVVLIEPLIDTIRIGELKRRYTL